MNSSSRSNNIVVADAAILYGAWRWWKSVHGKPEWAHLAYSRNDDFALFADLAHSLVLYDKVMFDVSSWQNLVGGDWYQTAVAEIVDLINASAGASIVELCNLFVEPSSFAKRAVCRLVRDVVARTEHGLQRILRADVPWAYKHPGHVDRRLFEDFLLDLTLPVEVLPFTLFAYRGIHYAGTMLEVETGQPIGGYYAADRRLAALEILLRKETVERLRFQKTGYSDLLNDLGLPPSGYDFSRVPDLMSAEVSRLTVELDSRDPAEGLAFAIALRGTAAGSLLRSQWWARVEGVRYISGLSAPSQAVTNTVVHGDLNMVLAVANSAA